MSHESQFEKIFDNLLVTKDYCSTLTLLQSAEYKKLVEVECSDAIQTCAKYLTDENYEENLDLYCCCEEFLKYVASVASPQEVLLELLEIIEITPSDNVFTSVLKVLQICLQNQKKNRVNGLEWSLNCIQTFIDGIKLPSVLKRDCDDQSERLLEQDPTIQRVLMIYITITLFLEPLVNQAVAETNDAHSVYKDVTRNRRNILACFILQLLGQPLSLLDLTNRPDSSTNVNSLHCARNLSTALCKLLGDPFFLLSYAESKVRWKRKPSRGDEDGVYEKSPKDVFLLDEKTPLASIGIFYYLLLAEDLLVPNAPKVYHPLYIFEMGLYLVNHLLRCEETALHNKGIRLGLKLVQNLNTHAINSNSLSLNINPDFCMSLSKIIIFSTVERNRKLGLKLLTEYILHFDVSGKFYLLQNLIRTTEHSGLKSYLIGMYKNLIANSFNSDELPQHFKSGDFKDFMLQTVCTLPQKVETDLVQNSETVIAALNVIRYLAIRDDKENRTGFWNFVSELDKFYLIPLRTAIDLSRAHFKAERMKVSNSKDEVMELPKELEISLQSGEGMPEITKQHKLRMLDGALLTFDLMDSLLGRVNECVDDGRKNKA